MEVQDYEQSLVDQMGEFYNDPLGFILFAFPWGDDGLDAPDDWQVEQLQGIKAALLENPLATIQEAISSGHGIGKAISSSVPAKKLLLPPLSNKKVVIGMEDIKWGDLKTGDYVFGKDGTPTKITNTRDFKQLEHFKVTFDDGSFLVVAGEHEWNVKGRQERRKGIDKWRTLETKELLKLGVKRPNGKAMARQWEIPTCDPVQFEHNYSLFDPYAVGVWLGDGNSSSGTIASSRLEIWDKLGVRPNVDTKDYKDRGILRASPKGMMECLREVGMMPTSCDTKFIADEYKYNSEHSRRELLRGMLDSDGEVHKSGSIGYSSTSKRLVDDLIWMVRSLGGKAMMQPTVKTTFYTLADGSRSEDCKPCYRCTVNFGGTWNPFTHTIKRAALSDKVEPRYTKRWIESIEPVGKKDCMCITVEAEDHLYLANDFIVTHNSAEVAWLILWAMSTRPHLAGWVTANTQNQLVKKTWRELAIWHKRMINAHWFKWTATRFHHIEHAETWGMDAIPWSEHNSEAFAGLHAKHVLIIMDEACHDDQTEVMTNTGWKLFTDVKEADTLLTMDKATFEVGFQKPIRHHKYWHTGEMKLVEQNGTNFCVTPNHKMLVNQQNGRNPDKPYPWKLREIQDLSLANHQMMHSIPNWHGNTSDICVAGFTSERKDYPERYFNRAKFSRFIGWYLSEGSLVKKPLKSGIAYFSTIISQNTGTNLNDILVTLNVLGLNYKVYDSSTPNSKNVVLNDRALSEWLATFGVGCLVKRCPREVLDGDVESLSQMLDAFMLGDGYEKGSRKILYTSCAGLSDDLHEAALKTGVDSVITERALGTVSIIDGREVSTNNKGYVVSVTDKARLTYLRTSQVKNVDYEGYVYCAEVPNHTLLTRRKGKALWSGNSAIADSIWEVSEGAMTTPRAMWFCFGNPTRNSGRFRECFGKYRHRWTTKKIDSRSCKMTNKYKIAEWETDHGEDSDFFRIRVRGEFPQSGSNQLISSGAVEANRKLTLLAEDYMYQPVIIGCDVARFGSDETVITTRQGRKILRQKEYMGLDNVQVAMRCVEEYRKHPQATMMVDEVGVGSGVVDYLKNLNYPVMGVNAGASPEKKTKFMNLRAEMWFRMKEWVEAGADIPDDPELAEQLTGLEYDYTPKEQIRLEKKEDMKARGLCSPDRADSLALTFAFHVAPVATGNHQSSFEPEEY